MKQKAKIKEPVRLRVKHLANGNQSLYLDTYHNGKRSYEFLRLYLIPERTAEDKAINDATMQAATAIKAKRILAFINGKGGIRNPEYILSIKDWIENIIKEKRGVQSYSSLMLMKRLIKHLQKYRPSAKLADVDYGFCVGFADYLRSARALNSSKPLMQSTQFELLNALSIILNEAVRTELINKNPMHLLNGKDRIKKPESTREYLTADEVKSFIEAAADNINAGDDVAAFIFCCFCGLRYSDISRITWGNIMATDKGVMITMIMKKTRRRVEVPLSVKAAELLPPQGDPEAPVFTFPHYVVTLRKLKRIAKAAGIKKK